ncbi:MAG: hypothetical protein ACREPM_03045 [Gemmatimonadaceae bacterium]
MGFLFGALGCGETFSSAVREAIDRGFAEPDPRIDLSGIHVARKALILARAIGFRGELSDVTVETLVSDSIARAPLRELMSRAADLDDDWAKRVARSARDGKVLRDRAHITPHSISVGLASVAATDPLATLHGTDNQFTFTTTRYRDQPSHYGARCRSRRNSGGRLQRTSASRAVDRGGHAGIAQATVVR